MWVSKDWVYGRAELRAGEGMSLVSIPAVL